MKKRLVVLAASIALAGSAAVSAPAATAAPEDWDLILNQGPPVLVDSIVIDGVVIERTFQAVLRDDEGRKVGILYGLVHRIDAKGRPGVEIRYRTLVFEFADGQVIAEGVSKYNTRGPFLKPDSPSTIAITGGTGAYVGVKGELKTVHLGKGVHRQKLNFVD
ncbi:MAG: allene oxide cyclase barrel-like domain-containing protein [bacterium]